MKQDELQKVLMNLHEELGKSVQFDDATRQALLVLLDDIQRVVSNPTHGLVVAKAREQSVSTRLQTTVQELEINHPRLTGLLQQIVDRLADLGI